MRGLYFCQSVSKALVSPLCVRRTSVSSSGSGASSMDSRVPVQCGQHLIKTCFSQRSPGLRNCSGTVLVFRTRRARMNAGYHKHVRRRGRVLPQPRRRGEKPPAGKRIGSISRVPPPFINAPAKNATNERGTEAVATRPLNLRDLRNRWMSYLFSAFSAGSADNPFNLWIRRVCRVDSVAVPAL